MQAAKSLSLQANERTHILNFVNARPDWSTLIMSERVFDEFDGPREHKYPKPHPYLTGMHYVLRRLVPLAPCKVLDVGSPLMQNVAASAIPGIEMTVLDIRPPADAGRFGLNWQHGSATALPFADASWPVVTSLWVMGHVGDGRYGDELRVDGDLEMLAEIARVLRPGGTALLGPGLVDSLPGTIYNLHRIYSWAWLCEAFRDAGLDLVESRDLEVADEWFIDRDGAKPTMKRRAGHYAIATLRKP